VGYTMQRPNKDKAQCEQCGTLMDEPAKTQNHAGYNETVTLSFCEDCS